MYQTASDVLGYPERKHQDWLDEHDEHLKKLLEARNTARQENLQCNTRSRRKKYSKAQSELQKYTIEMKSNWWDEKAQKLQIAADRKYMKTFFTDLREIYGTKPRGLIQLKAMDGETVLQEKGKILDRIADHFDQLLNNPGDLSEEAKEALVQRPAVSSLDEPPNFDELMSTIRTTQDGKAPGGDGIPAEVWKFGGVQLTNCLHKLIQEIWDAQKIPQDWKDASIVPLFKKGERKDCGNYRGISLLATVGKILSRVLLKRLGEHISQNVLPETQCGFRSGRSTMNMIFCLK